MVTKENCAKHSAERCPAAFAANLFTKLFLGSVFSVKVSESYDYNDLTVKEHSVTIVSPIAISPFGVCLGTESLCVDRLNAETLELSAIMCFT